jgi:hypothetical protein
MGPGERRMATSSSEDFALSSATMRRSSWLYFCRMRRL